MDYVQTIKDELQQLPTKIKLNFCQGILRFIPAVMVQEIYSSGLLCPTGIYMH